MLLVGRTIDFTLGLAEPEGADRVRPSRVEAGAKATKNKSIEKEVPYSASRIGLHGPPAYPRAAIDYSILA